MRGLWNTAARAAVVLIASAALAAAMTTPVPGTLNYIEGQVMLNGRNMAAASTSSNVVAPGQVLDTDQGNAEMLLTPGVFLRLGHHSEVRMVSPALANTRVAVTKGEAMLEVTELFKENDLSVAMDGAITRIDKKGLYDFNAEQPAVGVLDGQATVYESDAHVKLKKGHEVLLASGDPLKARHLDRNAIEADALYRWSKLRGEYESEASQASAQTIVVGGAWWGPGWYWNPSWDCYAFLPPYGVLYSPFGWGFYSPSWVWSAPHYFYRYPAIHVWRPPTGAFHARVTPTFRPPDAGRIGDGFHPDFGRR